MRLRTTTADKNQERAVGSNYQCPVVQNSVSLTVSLSPQLVSYISTPKANTCTLLFFVENNVRILCNAKDSHIFLTKNHIVFVIFMFEILTNR